MDLFSRDDLLTLLAFGQEPCISLFMPTHRRGAEEDPVRWKNLLREAEEYLKASGLRASETKELLGPAHKLLADPSFWKNQSDGLAFFLSPKLVRSYRLPTAFAELAMVAKRFHIKPLLPLLRENGRFYVLAISQNRVRLLQGTYSSVHEVDLKNVPASLAEAMQFHDKDEPLLFHTRTAGGTGSWGAIFHGHGVGIDDFKDDLLRYFRQVDRGLHELLRNEHAPLVLAAVKYLWPIYREANRYPHLLEHGIAGNPDRLGVKELHEKAWAIVQPYFHQTQKKAADFYAQLAGTGRTSNDLEEIVRAAHQGHLELLFVAQGKEQWGTFDASSGKVTVHDQAEPGDEDLLNFAALHTLGHGGKVYVVGSEEVPGKCSAAAIFWLPHARKEKPR